jgi:gliding motility-associated-like protein
MKNNFIQFIGCCLVIIFSNLNSFAQNNFTILEGDSVTVTCNNPCDTLHASYLKKKATTSYIYDTLPYSVSTLTASNILSLGDDDFSGAVPIGFNFCFYNNIYNTIYISANGVLTFNANYANNPCSFDTKTLYPYFNSTFADAAISGPFMDLKPSIGGTISYQTIGVAPNRKFVVQYHNLKLFGATCANTTSTFEIILYELSNYIDIQITDKNICDADTSNYLNFATIGIQSIAASNYLTVNGKHASIWSANNIGYRFLPNGGPNYSVQWANASSPNIPFSTNLDSVIVCGGQTVIGTVTYSCPLITISDTINLFQQGLSIDSISFTRPICHYSTNGSVTIYSNGINLPHTYSIDNLPYTTNNIFTGLDTGKHYLFAKDANGCIVSDTVNLISYSTLAGAMVTTEASCDTLNPDGTAIVTTQGGVTPITYLWNTGITVPNLVNLIGNTSYTCVVTDSLNCKDTVTGYVPKFQLTVVTDSIKKATCPNNDGYVQVHGEGGIAPYTYLWSNGDTTSILSNLAPGNYNVTVTDSVGCFKTTTVIIGLDSLPTITGNFTDNICNFNNGTITTSVTGGAPPYNYLWNTGATTSNLTGLDSGLYILTITDSKGCTSANFFTIKDTFRLKTTHLSTPTKCGLNNGIATVNAMYGQPPYLYSWSSVPNTTNTVANLPAGLNICTTTDVNGCVSFDTIFIGPSQALTATASIANANCDSANGSILMTPNNGNAPYSYSWNTGNITAGINNLAANQFYICTITDNKGCIFKDTIYLLNDGKPYLNVVSFTPPICHGDSTGTAVLQGFLGVNPYKYSLDGINFSTSAVISNIPGGNILIYVKDANSCINDTIINFVQPPLLVFNYKVPDTLICFNSIAESVKVLTSGGFAPYEYALNNGAYKPNNEFSNLGMGTYTIFVRDSIGCVREIEFSVNGPDEQLQVNFDKKDVPCFEKNGGELIAKISGGWPPYNYNWENGSTDLIRDSLAAALYKIKGLDSKGCEVNASLEVKQEVCCVCKVPTAFTPNGDLLNDKLELFSLASNYTEFYFAVYNRLGQKVYETSDVNLGWDGQLHDKRMPTDTYYYYLRFKCNSEDNIILQKGDFTLIR